jgi:hypothetical protein
MRSRVASSAVARFEAWVAASIADGELAPMQCSSRAAYASHSGIVAVVDDEPLELLPQFSDKSALSASVTV